MRVHGTPQPARTGGKKRNFEHKFHVSMSSSGGKNKVSVVLVRVLEYCHKVQPKPSLNYAYVLKSNVEGLSIT